LTARAAAGHASMPPAHSAIGLVSAAVARLEAQQPPPRLDGATRALFAELAPLLPFVPRLAFANLWLMQPVVLRQLTASASTNALVRTTTAVTMVEGGVRPNVLPASAQATVNMRLLPGDTIEGTLAHVRRVVGETIEVSVVGEPWAPSSVSDATSEGYRVLADAVRQTAPGVVVAPYLVPGATDARHYGEIAANTYRFLPLRFKSNDLNRLHGVNERVSVEDYSRAIAILERLIRALAG
jgi:carboxypeptidase PM20D1